VPRFYPARNLIVVCIVCLIREEQLPTSCQLVDGSLLYTDPLMITNRFQPLILTNLALICRESALAISFYTFPFSASS
jgi:hypothetical protein